MVFHVQYKTANGAEGAGEFDTFEEAWQAAHDIADEFEDQESGFIRVTESKKEECGEGLIFVTSPRGPEIAHEFVLILVKRRA